MSRWKGLRARLASLRRSAAERRMEEEFRFHVELETEQNLRRGMDPATARRRAQLAFGAVEAHREVMREARGLKLLEDLRQDVRYGLRGLARTPVFAVVGIVTIALGVGATTALFSMANAVLLRKPHVPEPERVQVLQEYRGGRVSSGAEGQRIPWPRYLQYREALTPQFVALAAHRTEAVSLRTTAEARPAFATLFGGDYFGVLGLAPELGRFPVSDDEPMAVLSHRAWQAQFGGAPDVIGSTAYINGRAFTIVAVAPLLLQGTVFGIVPDVWVPFGAYVSDTASGFDHWVTPFGRLRPGVSPAAAAAAAHAAGLRLEDPDATVHRVELEPFGPIPGSGRSIAVPFLGLLVGASLLVLFIAAANIAGMLLARAVARQREIAVRLSIGAGRGRLIRQLLTESLMLFLLGGSAGMLVAFWLTALLARLQVPVPGMTIELSATPDLRVLLFALVISVIPAVLFGLVPALQATRPQVVTALRESARGGSVHTVRVRSAFVIGQLAMAVLLLVTAGLFVRSLRHGLQIDPGFDSEGVVVAAVNLTPHGYDETRGRAFLDELTARVHARPDVESVALARRVLLSGQAYGTRVRAGDDPAGERSVGVRVNVVDTAYFASLRMRLLAGRGFDSRDAAGAPQVAVVNETLARRLWPDGPALGRTFFEGERQFEVIGVMTDGRYVQVGEGPTPFMFLPHAQHYSGSMVLHVRGSSAAALAPVLRREVSALDPNVALEFVTPLEQLTQVTLFPHRLAARIVGALGILGLLLAGIGVYGVLMYHVMQRVHEFGIRMALGARAADLAGGVLVRALRITAVGVLLGVTGAWFLARLISGFVFGISVRDPFTFAAVPLVLGVFALAASWYPAYRASRADPMQVLRAD